MRFTPKTVKFFLGYWECEDHLKMVCAAVFWESQGLFLVAWPVSSGLKIAVFTDLCSNWCHWTVTINYQCLSSQPTKHFQIQQHCHVNGKKEEAASFTSSCHHSGCISVFSGLAQLEGLNPIYFPQQITIMFSPLLGSHLPLRKRNQLPRISSCS